MAGIAGTRYMVWFAHPLKPWQHELITSVALRRGEGWTRGSKHLIAHSLDAHGLNMLEDALPQLIERTEIAGRNSTIR